MSEKRSAGRLRPADIVIALIAGLPVLALLVMALSGSTGAGGLGARMLPFALRDTGLLLAMVGLATALIGFVAAWLVTHFDFPFRRIAEWGFVLSAHFWSTGVFVDAADALAEFAFTTMGVDRLDARIASRNQRAHAAIKKLGARFEATLTESSPIGIARDPESVWSLRADDWRSRPGDPRASAANAAARLRSAVEAAENEVRRSEAPETVEPYPLFLFDRRRRG